MISANIAAVLYLVAGVLFIMALRGLSSPSTARRGNTYGMVGMTIAVLTTLAVANPSDMLSWGLIVGGIAIGGGIGAVMAKRIAMTDMPQLVAAFHSLVGLRLCLWRRQRFMRLTLRHCDRWAYSCPGAGGNEHWCCHWCLYLHWFGYRLCQLNGNMSGRPIILPARHLIHIVMGLVLLALVWQFTITADPVLFWAITVLALVLGGLMIIPIGGADMPVVVSMLNSYSGWAAAGIGFTLGNTALIITGALVGSSGAILSYIMCKAMNRSFISVILGGFGGDTSSAGAGEEETRPVKQGSADDAAFMMKNAGKVIIVPGYGMAVAQAQHAAGNGGSAQGRRR